jgi:predicted peptidase
MPRTALEGAARGRIGLQRFRRLSIVQRLLLLQAALNVLLIPLWFRDWDPASQRSRRVDEKTAKQFLTCCLPSSDDVASQKSTCYRLLAPSSIDAGKTYPLLVFLHGAGERGSDNVNQLTHLPAQMSLPRWRSQFPCFLLAPQCPANERWSSSVSGYPDRLELVMAMIRQTLKSNPIDSRRVYLTGLSMGGFGTWELVARYPDAFAAAVPICGGGDVARAARLVQVPIWAVHGDRDQTVPVRYSQTMIDALRAAGANPRYSELTGVGHECWTAAYADPQGVLAWMFEQVNSRTPDFGSQDPVAAGG